MTVCCVCFSLDSKIRIVTKLREPCVLGKFTDFCGDNVFLEFASDFMSKFLK